MNDFTPLAFVDVETTGVNPRANRITEIGVVTVDGDQVEEWTTLVNPSTRPGERGPPPEGVADVDLADAPRFKDFAVDLARRLAGRLFVAHNARFDYGFLKAEFGRIGMEFAPDVLCSVMLSRKLYSQLPHHDLDSVMERHGLQTEARHRALPDAKLIWQFWQIIHQEQPAQSIAHAIEALLAGPVLPVHLDPSLIERLPEAPGVYVLHGEHDSVLQVGKASNLKRHLLNYFRMDLTSAKALAISHRISNITWRTTQGMLGAHFQYAALSKTLSPLKRHAASQSLFSWQLVPDACPSMALVSLANGPLPGKEELFGIYGSERKARNALLRVAASHRLCHALLGLSEAANASCLACPRGAVGASCDGNVDRLRHLEHAFTALRPLRLPAWPYGGPVGIRERSDLHVVDNWRYLGTARSEDELAAVLEARPRDFDQAVFGVLAKTLPRLPQRRIVCLSRAPDRRELECGAS